MESNAFVRAKRERWLNAIRYFSSRSLSSMKAWSHWEDMHRQWREKKPETLPTYEVWVSAASAVGRLPNPESDAQTVLDSIRLVPEETWRRMLDAFAELTTLCVWIEILLGAGQIGAEFVSEELAVRYPRFDTCGIPEPTGSGMSTFFAESILTHRLPFANAQQFLFALSYQTKQHPAYYARCSYAAQCRSLWRGRRKPTTGYHRFRTGELRRTRALRASLSRTFQRMIPDVPSCASVTSVGSDCWAGRRGLPLPPYAVQEFADVLLEHERLWPWITYVEQVVWCSTAIRRTKIRSG